MVLPKPTPAIAFHTERWNGVPRGASFTEKRWRLPEKYSASSRFALRNCG